MNLIKIENLILIEFLHLSPTYFQIWLHLSLSIKVTLVKTLNFITKDIVSNYY